MLAKKNKLSGFELTQVLKSGQKINKPLFNLYFIADVFDVFKAGVIISKKLKLKAHERNRIKRRLFSALKESFKMSDNLALVVYLKNKEFLKKELIDACLSLKQKK